MIKFLTLADTIRLGSGDSSGGLINGLIFLVVVGLIFWLLWWLVSYVGLPEPFNKVARVILALIAVIVVIKVLLSMTGVSF